MRIFYCCILLVLASCGEIKLTGNEQAPKNSKVKPDSTETAAFDTLYYGIKTRGESAKVYEHQKKQINLQRKILYTQYLLHEGSTNILDTARYFMTENLLNNIIPYWYGTKWNFEGYTALPGQGYIACGYFVSTTLKHMGLQVDRYRLAQKDPKTEALSIQMADSVETHNDLSPRELKEYFMQHKKDGLYFAGLSNHVGYLLKRKGELFFIHSNYIGSQGVTIEKACFSKALASSGIYYVADITHNDELVKTWLLGRSLIVR